MIQCRPFSRLMRGVALAALAAGAGPADAAPRRPPASARPFDAPADPASLCAAIDDLEATFGARYPKGRAYRERLDAIRKRIEASDPAAAADLAVLAREALLANPLVRDHPILYVRRAQYAPDHHNTETMFQTGEICTSKFRGPGALKVVDVASGGQVRPLLDLPEGIVRDPDVSFDGRRVLFAMRRNIRDDYHLYEIRADGSGLRQLTFGPGLSDIDPLYLPDGRIAFTSTREPKYCMCNRHIMGNLFRMDADGANIHQIGKSTLFEGHGSLMPDGRILYDRWEYVDRNFGDAQGLWTCNPDGTSHAVFYGNNTRCPDAAIDARPVPGADADRVICVFAACHDRPWGALALLDRRRGVDGRGPVVRTWPPDAARLVMNAGIDAFKGVRPKYEDPCPLSDNYFLCARQVREPGEEMGLYLVDVFGNEVLVHADPPGCYDPMPLAPRPVPPLMPDRVALDRAEGYFYVGNVYVGTGMERVPRGAVKFLRVVEVPEKRFWTHPAWDGQGQEAPAINWHDFNTKRILGAAAVEDDGSAYVAVPADRFVYFQLLDADGMMIQSMRSGTIVRPGETAGCAGCHEDRLSAAPVGAPEALRRPPRKLDPWYGPARDFSYAQEVQPVFDRHCVRCHDQGKDGAKKLLLNGDRGLAFNVSYHELWQKKYIQAIGAGPADIQPPYAWGAQASRLVKVLRAGHNDIRLTREDLDRIVTWIDLNAPYYPSYASCYPDNLYGRSPLSAAQLKRLTDLTGAKFGGHEGDRLVNLTRPEISPCLVGFKDRSDPKLAEALAILRAGVEMLAKRPREDMTGSRLDGLDAQRESRYQERARIEADVRRAILNGVKIYPYPAGQAVRLMTPRRTGTLLSRSADPENGRPALSWPLRVSLPACFSRGTTRRLYPETRRIRERPGPLWGPSIRRRAGSTPVPAGRGAWQAG
jgi:hypothetical protein